MVFLYTQNQRIPATYFPFLYLFCSLNFILRFQVEIAGVVADP